ncbi:hypothetical protein BDZ91DRAFT_760719 [Kalaharituber pfeilii]|nr:hypothetical protein BDZ91DRAFT_760719 [Kalaharituber pfeilii]
MQCSDREVSSSCRCMLASLASVGGEMTKRGYASEMQVKRWKRGRLAGAHQLSLTDRKAGKRHDIFTAARIARALGRGTKEGSGEGVLIYCRGGGAKTQVDAAKAIRSLELFHLVGVFANSRYLIYLEVREKYRGRGYGKALISALAEEVDGARLEWSVLKWNTPSIEFYESEAIGATAMSEWRLRLKKLAIGGPMCGIRTKPWPDKAEGRESREYFKQPKVIYIFISSISNFQRKLTYFTTRKSTIATFTMSEPIPESIPTSMDPQAGINIPRNRHFISFVSTVSLPIFHLIAEWGCGGGGGGWATDME